MPSVWTELTGLRVPTLWITGEEDPKFSAIARDAIALMPDASHVVIRRAGHCAHLERPDEVAAQVWGFLRQTGEG